MAGFRAVFLLLVLANTVWAQDNRYLVSFRNKSGTPYNTGQPQAFLSQRSIDRRTHSGVTVSTDDLPVTPAYVTQLRAKGAKVFFTTRWMNAALVEAAPAVASAISGLPFVLQAELVAPGKKLIGGRPGKFTQSHATKTQASQHQLEMLGIDIMHASGFHGEGVMIAILDGGFSGTNTAEAFQSIFSEGRIGMTLDFVTNSGNVFQFDSHGTEVFSTIAATLTGSYTGGAYKATYLLFVTEDVGSEYRIEEYNWLFAAERADSAGADVIQSSLGYNLFDNSKMDYKISDLDGSTTVVSRAASMARDRGMVVVVSAGNEGSAPWHYITAPADVDGILAAGAINTSHIKSGFSSFGPTSDGRIKPDVAALGENTSVILSDGTVGTGSGTSFAAPLVTSLVAGLIQSHPELTPAQLIQIVKLSADQSSAPDNQLGFGVPNYQAVNNYLKSTRSGADVFIYPNPAASFLNLAFRNLPEDPVELSIYDMQGRVLSNLTTSFMWTNNPMPISLENLSTGMYLLQVKTRMMVRAFRFVKV